MEKNEKQNIYLDKVKEELSLSDIRYYADLQKSFNLLDNHMDVVVSDGNEYQLSGNRLLLPKKYSTLKTSEDFDTLDEEDRFKFARLALQGGGFNFRDDEYNINFKSMVAGYFASKRVEDGPCKIPYAGATFNVLTPYSNILETVMSEIAQIVSNKELSWALMCGSNRLYFILKEITKKSSSKFFDKLEAVDGDIKRCEKLRKIVACNERLKNKIKKLETIFQNNKSFYGYPNLSAIVYEYADFDLNEAFPKDEYDSSDQLTESEKELVKKYLELAEQRNLRFRESIALAKSNKHSVFVNKLDCVFDDYEHQLNIAEQLLLNHFKELQRYILRVLVPAANKVSGIDTFNLDTLLLYSSYDHSSKPFSLESDSKVQRLDRKINNHSI